MGRSAEALLTEYARRQTRRNGVSVWKYVLSGRESAKPGGTAGSKRSCPGRNAGTGFLFCIRCHREEQSDVAIPQSGAKRF